MRKSGEIIRVDYKITISVDAENDTNDAYIYYENIQNGLGERFLSELIVFYQKIKVTLLIFLLFMKTKPFVLLL